MMGCDNSNYQKNVVALDELAAVLAIARRLASDLIMDTDNTGLVAAITQAHALAQHLTRHRIRA